MLLSLRATPHKYSKPFVDTLLHRIDEDDDDDDGTTTLVHSVRALAAGLGNSRRPPPPCPEFLFTRDPCFPWAPRLCSVEAAAVVAQEEEEEEQNTHSGHDEHSVQRLEEAQGIVRSYVQQEECHQCLQPQCLEALEIVLLAAAAASNSALILNGAGLCCSLAADALQVIISTTITPSSSYSRCSVVARGILLPAAVALDAPPPQSITAAATQLGECNPQALVEHCLRPLLLLQQFTKHHAEFICRLVKQGTAVPNTMMYTVIDATTATTGGGGDVLWSEHIVAVVQSVLDTKPSLPAPTITALTTSMLRAAQQSLNGSIKLAKMMLVFVRGWGKEMGGGGDVERCRAAAEAVGTFMAKTILSALNK